MSVKKCIGPTWVSVEVFAHGYENVSHIGKHAVLKLLETVILRCT
jgi:hypothetical protein